MTKDKLPVIAAVETPPLAPSFELDEDKYLAEVAAFDIPEAKKREFLQVLWSIMRHFVEAGVSVDLCGQLLEDGFAGRGAGVDSAGSPETETPSDNNE